MEIGKGKIYLNGEFIGDTETTDFKISDIDNSRAYTGFQPVYEGDIQFEKVEISKEYTEELKQMADAVIKAFKEVAKMIIKAWDAIKKFINNNPWIMDLRHNNIKFNKRTANRNKLYIKRKKLGRKL